MHVLAYWYNLANRQGLFVYVRTCKNRHDTTTKFMVVVTSMFSLVISSFPDNMFYHVWTTLLIYHDGSNNVVQICSFIKPWAVWSNAVLASVQLGRPTEILRPRNVRPNWRHISRVGRVQASPLPPGIFWKFGSRKWHFLHFEGTFEQYLKVSNHF